MKGVKKRNTLNDLRKGQTREILEMIYERCKKEEHFKRFKKRANKGNTLNDL